MCLGAYLCSPFMFPTSSMKKRTPSLNTKDLHDFGKSDTELGDCRSYYDKSSLLTAIQAPHFFVNDGLLASNGSVASPNFTGSSLNSPAARSLSGMYAECGQRPSLILIVRSRRLPHISLSCSIRFENRRYVTLLLIDAVKNGE